jgi:hypothetical protein
VSITKFENMRIGNQDEQAVNICNPSTGETGELEAFSPGIEVNTGGSGRAPKSA